MRHNVHLFLGSDFQSTAQDLKEYVMKYGGEASPYFNVLLLESNENNETLIRRAKCSEVDDKSHNELDVSFDPDIADFKSEPNPIKSISKAELQFLTASTIFLIPSTIPSEKSGKYTVNSKVDESPGFVIVTNSRNN